VPGDRGPPLVIRIATGSLIHVYVKASTLLVAVGRVAVAILSAEHTHEVPGRA
jgi:hypothetical protein